MRRTSTLIGFVLLATVAAFVSPAVAAADDTYIVRILVLDPAGHPVAGVGVSDAQHQIGGVSNSAGRLVLRGVTNPPASSTFCAILIPETQHLAGPTGWSDACRSQPVVDGVENLTLRFGVGAAIGGRLVDAGTGAPIAGGRVCRFEDESLTYPFCFTADADGRWVVPNLPAGTFGFRVYAFGSVTPGAPHGYATARLLDITDSVTLRAGRITPLGTARLVPLVGFTGTVVDATGAAVAGATVSVGDVDGDPTTAFDSVDTTTDAYGRYSVAAMPAVAHPHRLICARAGAATTHPTGLALRCTTSNDTALTVTMPFTLADGGALTGSVAGVRGVGSFLAEVIVRVGNEDVAIPALHTGGTTYRVDGVPAGTRTVTARSSKPFRPAYTSSPVTVRPDSVTTVPTITIGA